jgi:hypothetical protein
MKQSHFWEANSRSAAQKYSPSFVEHKSPPLAPILSQMNKDYSRVGFEVLMAASMKMAVFWIVALCSLVEVYQRFRGTYCLHHHPDTEIILFTYPRTC